MDIMDHQELIVELPRHYQSAKETNLKHLLMEKNPLVGPKRHA